MRRKIYGQSKSDTCAFCNKMATVENSQGFPTCVIHKQENMPEKKCICGEYLDVKKSKWGPFYLCKNCGPLSPRKVEEMAKGDFKLNKKLREKTKQPKNQEPIYDVNKVYTLDELEMLWE
jgi:hypothetical protein